MKVFVTGATGWVGTLVVKELIKAGHHVTGLSRSKDKANVLSSAGAKVILGTLDDFDILRTAAAAADAVVHTAFNHDFSRFAESAEQDRRAIEVMGGALEGSNKPLLVTSGVAGLAQGRSATEDDKPSPDFFRKSESAADELAKRGVRVARIRLAPSVHGVGEHHGFIPVLIALARKTGVSAYVDKGDNCWAAVHRSDAARLYQLVLEKGVTEAAYHVAAEEGVPFKKIAEVIGRRLGLPVESRTREHFGWFAKFAGENMAASSERTSSLLGWKPMGPELLTDIDQPGYYEI